MTSRKRSLPEDIANDTNNNNIKKRRIENISQFVENKKISDVIFTVGVNGDTEQYHGVKAFFASQSEVLCNMLYGRMEEAINKEITINDITKEAFVFLRDYCYLRTPELQFSQATDILYVAQKYMIHNLIQACNDKILSMDDVDTFYIVMESIAKYAPSTFESIVKKIMDSLFVNQNILDIIKSEKCNLLPLFQIKLLGELVKFDEFEKYNVIKQYCIKNNNNDNNINKNNSNSTAWQIFYIIHFEGMVDFDLLNVQQLLGDVRNDKVISETKLLNRIDKKVKNMQTTINNLSGDNNSLQAENINLEFRVDELNEQIKELQQKCKKLKKVRKGYSFGWNSDDENRQNPWS